MKTKYIDSQKGAALILLVFTLCLMMATYVFRELNVDTLKTKNDVKTMSTLAEAKRDLIAWAVNNKNRPGLMPYPDRNTDGNYDGTSDCYTGSLTGNYDKLLGQLPWKAADDANCTNLVAGVGQEYRDSSSEHLWYAVSRNLVYDYSTSTYPTINPGIISTPTYPWMIVLDKNGNVVSSRVAAIIIAPESPNADQDRSSAIPSSAQYLDKFYIGTSIYSNTGYSTAAEDWVIGEDARGVSSSNTTYQQPYYFNDKLVYITIDELMVELEKRVAGEARSALNTYKSTNGVYPFAAALGSSTNPNQCVKSNLQGLLPTTTPSSYTCSCSALSGTTRSCSCSFSAVTTMAYVRTTGGGYSTSGVGAPTGGCSVGGASNRTCTCRGSGTCKNTTGTVRVTCDACGNCSSTQSGSFLFTSSAGFSASTGGCTSSGANISCNGTTAGTFTLNSCTNPVIPTAPTVGGLPTWFTASGWQNYIYYAVSTNCTTGGSNCTTASPQLTVGSKTGVQALVIASGMPISTSPYAASKAGTQGTTRPTCDVKDYLDSSLSVSSSLNRNATTNPTNYLLTNGDWHLQYDDINLPRNSSYNDQIFVVAP